MNLWKCHMADIGDLNSLSQQNAMRIRVNRVPLIQEINVEHILESLTASRVLSETEVATVMHGANRAHRTRTLLQILVNKDRDSHWYKHFRHSLRDAACDSATRKRYAMLAEFLDNTIIRKDVVGAASPDSGRGPTEEVSFPRYEPLPSIPQRGILAGTVRPRSVEDLSPETSNLSRRIHEAEVAVPEEYESVLEPTYQRQVAALEKVPMKTVKKQLKQERLVYLHMRKVEFFLRHSARKEGELVRLCTLPPVAQLIRQPRLVPLAYKYIRVMEKDFLLPVLAELQASFELFVDGQSGKRDKDTRKSVAKTGALLSDLFLGYGNIDGAERIVARVIQYLCEEEEMDAWLQTFHAQVKLLEVRTANWYLKEADNAFHAAQMTADKVQLMSFGQDLLDKSEFMAHVGQMLLLQGSHNPGYDFATKALKHLRGHNSARVSKVIQHAILAYYEKWNGKRAERLAVFLVRYAWVHFGTFSAVYIQSLLSLVRVLTRFRPSDSFTVEVARNAVSYAEVLFGCETPLLAEAYLLLSQALVAARCTDGLDYLKYAKMGMKCVVSCLGEGHPQVAWYCLGLGKALLFKAQTSKDTAFLASTLGWAECETSKALDKLLPHFGDISLPSCEARMTLARIYKEKGRREEAIKVLMFIENIYRLCVSPRSHVALFFCAEYARHLRDDADKLHDEAAEDPDAAKAIESANRNALRLARRVIDNVECYGTYTPWVEECYDIAHSIFLEQGHDTNADEVKAHKEDWLIQNVLRDEPLSWEGLHQAPDPKFLEEWDVWGKHKQTFLKLAQLPTENAAEPEDENEVA